MFLYKNLFFSISILSIPIMLIGINGGYFPAICRLCLFTCGILKQFFLNFCGWEVWLWFCFNFRLVLVEVWRFLEIHMSLMLIRRFFMYFAEFWANFCNFLRFVLYYCLKWALKRPLLLKIFLDNKWLRFCGYEDFFCSAIWQSGENWNYFS